MLAPAPSDASSTTLKSTDLHSLPTATPTMSPIDSQNLSASQSQPTELSRNDDNPWLSRNGQPSHTTLKKNDIAVSKDSTSAVKAKNKLRKRQRETRDEMEKSHDDSVLEISPTDLLVASSKGGRQAEHGSCSSDGDTEVEEQEDRLKGKGKHRVGPKHIFKQSELVARAFAGDNVIQVRG
jgi:U3 small nucleolar RNA-associated protein 14